MERPCNLDPVCTQRKIFQNNQRNHKNPDSVCRLWLISCYETVIEEVGWESQQCLSWCHEYQDNLLHVLIFSSVQPACFVAALTHDPQLSGRRSRSQSTGRWQLIKGGCSDRRRVLQVSAMCFLWLVYNKYINIQILTHCDRCEGEGSSSRHNIMMKCVPAEGKFPANTTRNKRINFDYYYIY